MAVFPVFLKLEGRRVLVVGAGPVAAGKLRALLEAGARITVVAPDVVPEIASLAHEVEILRRPFEPSDLDGVWFVVAAAPPDGEPRRVDGGRGARALRERGRRHGERERVSGAIVRRAGVTMAISTDGEAPALAGLLREALEVLLPEDLDRWMALRAGRRGAMAGRSACRWPSGGRCCSRR